jgi:hypothetical protein
MAPRGSGGIRGFLDTGTDFRRLRSALWTFCEALADPRARLGVGVAGLLATAGAVHRLGPAARALTLTAIPLVGLTRLYVGAHLPLDIAGGAALGLAADAAAGLALTRTARTR